MVAYHDDEWGAPVADDADLFERLALESFQAGLSWSTILRKREAFRAAFAGFDPVAVAAFDERDVERLMADAGIVRNRAKILATIGNAQAFLATAETFGTFAAYLASVVPPPPARLPPDAVSGAIPGTTPSSDRLSADLRRRGFRFVGSTIVYAFMQSVGLVDDHLPGCFRYRGTAAVGLSVRRCRSENGVDCRPFWADSDRRPTMRIVEGTSVRETAAEAGESADLGGTVALAGAVPAEEGPHPAPTLKAQLSPRSLRSSAWRAASQASRDR